MGNKHNTGHGFTLIELLIVLVIIGILIGIGVPLLSKNLPAAKQTVFRENVDQIVDALEVYRSRAYIAGADCYYPESLQELAEGGYFTKIPINPYTGTSMLTDSATLSGLVYKRSDDCRGYTITLMDGMGDIAMGDSTSSGGNSQTGVFKVQITASPADVGYNKVMIATAGSTVTLPSAPDTTCYQFVNYTLDDPTLVLHNNEFIMPAHNVSVVAQYALKPNSQVTITYTGTPARTGVGTITNTYTCGSKVVLQAPQVTYYTFAGWFDTNNHIVSSANPWVFTAARDMTLWANYRSSVGTILYEHTGTVTVSTNTYIDAIDTTYSLYVPAWTLEYDVQSDVGATTSGMGVFISGPLVTISQGVYNEGVLRSIGLSVGKQGDSSVYTWTHVKVVVEQDSVNTAKYTYYINGNYHHTDFGQPIINPKQVAYNTSGSSQSVSYKNVIVYTNNTYTLRHVNIAWSPTNGGVVTPSVGYTVLDGTPVVVDFTAATGYHIDNVTINGNRANIGQVTRTQPTSYHLSTVANSDLVITASFVINTHVITLNPNGGTVTPTTISANYGATVSLPTPVRTDYTFQGWWTDPVGGTQWTSTMPVVQDITLYAHWVGMCQLTISVSPQDPSVYVAVTLGGNTTNVYTTTTITATTGSTIQLQAVSSSLCYVFDKYSGYNNSTSSVISITAPVGPKSITAHFIRPQFTIRTAIGSAGGSVTPLGTFTVPCGTSTTITFTPSTGYYVSSVLVDGTNKGSNISMVTFNDIVTSHTVTVNFAASQYTITLRTNPSGAGSPSASPNPATYGQTVTLSANPGACYNFSSWSSSDATLASTTASVTTFTMPAKNVTATANYTIKTYTINASAGTGGSISPSGQTTVNCGGSKTYTITPSAGYVIDSVIVDGINVGAVSSYTFSNVTKNHTIVANFRGAQGLNYKVGSSTFPGSTLDNACPASTNNMNYAENNMSVFQTGTTTDYTVSFITGQQAIQIETGYINIPVSGTYIFTIGADDNADLFINGQLVAWDYHTCDYFGNLSPNNGSNSINLLAGKYSVKIRLYNIGGPAGISINYSVNGSAATAVPVTWFTTN